MNEMPSNNFEEESEFIPTPEEVESVFEKLIGDKEYKEVERLEDEQGLYLLNISISGEEGDIEYSYRRGRPSERENVGLRIDIWFYDNDGIVTDGWSVAKYINRNWKIIDMEK